MDPVSTYLFILALDVIFTLVKSKKDVFGQKKDVFCLNNFDHEYLYAIYAGDTTFFVKDLNFAKEVLSNLRLYSNVNGLYPNLEKNINVAVHGMKSVYLVEYSIKILGVHISCNKRLKDNMNFQVAIKNITSVFKVWQMRNILLVGKIAVFKSLGF